MRIEWRPPTRGEVDHELVWTLVGVCSLAMTAAAVTTIGLPDVVCPFHAVTGIACPTCGGSRAFAALLDRRIADALRLNPLVAGAVLLFPVYAVYAVASVVSGSERVRVALDAPDRRRLRILAGCIVAVAWAFLVADGR
jgi:hypothetical protein